MKAFRAPIWTARLPNPPDLPCPENSYVVGYWWEAMDTPRGLPELRLDPKHLNTRGCYLASATCYQALTGQAVRASSFCPVDLGESDREFLAAVAHDTVAATVDVALR